MSLETDGLFVCICYYKCIYLHIRSLDEIPTGIYTLPDEYMTYTYSSPVITEIKINWGWWTQWKESDPVNDGWYTLTGNWYVHKGDDYYSYNHNLKMIHGFSVAQ